MRRPLVVLASLVLALLVLAAPAPAGAAPRPTADPGGAPVARLASPGQQPDAPADDGTGGSADEEPDENPAPGAAEQDIIPRPNSGHEPTDAGDRGGALQVLVLAAIVAGVGAIGGLAVRDVRRGRARAGVDRP